MYRQQGASGCAYSSCSRTEDKDGRQDSSVKVKQSIVGHEVELNSDTNTSVNTLIPYP